MVLNVESAPVYKSLVYKSIGMKIFLYENNKGTQDVLNTIAV